MDENVTVWELLVCHVRHMLKKIDKSSNNSQTKTTGCLYCLLPRNWMKYRLFKRQAAIVVRMKKAKIDLITELYLITSLSYCLLHKHIMHLLYNPKSLIFFS